MYLWCQYTLMDMQLFVVILIFSVAVVYIIRRFVLQFKGKKKAGCEKCGIADKDIQ